MRIDIKHPIASLLRRLALATALAAGSGLASAGVIHVDIDTSAFGANSGYLDLQLSATSGVPLATAVVSNMTGFGAIDLNYGWTPVPGGFLFRNDVSNYLSHAVGFGGVLSFDLSFAGSHDPLATYVSHFLVSAFDEDFTPMGAFDPATGALADFSWTPALNANGVGSIGISVADQHVTVVPEPADLLLMAAGLAAMALAMRRRGGAGVATEALGLGRGGRFLARRGAAENRLSHVCPRDHLHKANRCEVLHRPQR